MTDRLCNCGCGEPVYAASKSGYLRGHNTGASPASTPPRTQLAKQPPAQLEAARPDVQIAVELEAADPMDDVVEVTATRRSIERIWQLLTLEEKAGGVIGVLNR